MQHNRFGQWIFKLRKQRGLSRQELSARSEGRISQQYVHFIERGKALNIGSEKLKALADALDLPVQSLHQALATGNPPSIPLLGRAAAGTAIPTDPGEYAAPENLKLAETPEEPGLFAVEISGDSIQPVVAHGDTVIVRRHHEGDLLLPGHIYLLRHGRRLTCKYLMPDGAGGYMLSAENATLFPETLFKAPYVLVGRVIEVRKTHSLIKPLLG